MEIYSIGFTQKTAERFFTRLKDAGIGLLLDVRLNNVSQLAGFAKKQDLAYFLEEICGLNYVHLPDLAPTQEMLDEYKKNKGDWTVYERRFLDLMEERHVEKTIPKEVIESGCLLCSEHKPHHCHRRLIAEYLGRHWGAIEVNDLI